MVDDATVKALQRHWEDGWNAYKLDVIMEVFAREITFSSAFVARLTGDPQQTEVVGYEALRDYIKGSLQRVPGISYKLESTYVAPHSVILQYSFTLPDGTVKNGADIFKVGTDNKVVEWASHYPFAATEIDAFIAD